MDDTKSTLQKLIQASEKCYPDPYASLVWPERLDPEEHWYTSPELLTVHGTQAAAGIDERQLKRLGFYEAVNFYCINIHGEKLFVEGAAHRLYGCVGDEVTQYLHHFVNEENKHLTYFGRFCLRYAGKIYPSREGLAIARRYETGEEDLVFFLRVLISEEIIEVYNGLMANDARLHPLAREINYLHHRDEARHRLFGRLIAKELFDRHAPKWPAATVRDLHEYVRHAIERTWALYYNPEVYRDAGFERPDETAARVWADPAARKHRKDKLAPFVAYLGSSGLIDREPDW